MRLLMEGETKKRKITNLNYDEDEEDEDVKIEKFFALIRSAKDIRDQLLDAEGSKPRSKKAVATEKKAELVKAVRNAKSFSTDAAFKKTDAAAAADAAAAGGGSGSGNGANICRLSPGKGGKAADDKKDSTNIKGGRIFLDLNLSL